MKLTEAQFATIMYESSSSSEVSTRTILPVSVPKDTVRAFDVSDLTDAERSELKVLLDGYKEYMHGILQTTFKFEDWVEHTTGQSITPKWRTFSTRGIKDA